MLCNAGRAAAQTLRLLGIKSDTVMGNIGVANLWHASGPKIPCSYYTEILKCVVRIREIAASV